MVDASKPLGPQVPDRSDQPDSVRGVPGSVRWWLLGIIVLAFLLRLPGFLSDPVLLTEGTTYVTLARNLRAGRGYVGILGGPDWFISPLYPLLIAAVSFLTADAELAGRVISLVLGSLLPLPVYGLARHCFGRRPALVAALIVAGMPVLVQFSSLVWSETTYTFLVFLALMLAWWSLQRRRVVAGLAAGLLLGLAYLTRTEGVVYVGVLLVIVALLALLRREYRSHLGLLVAVAGGFLLVAAPYVTALSQHTGRLTLESKGRVNGLVTARVESGLTYHEAAYGLAADGEMVGPFLMREAILTQSRTLDTPELGLAGLAHHMVVNGRQAIDILRGQLLSSLLVLFAAFGVVSWRWDGPALQRGAPGLLLGLMLAFVLPRVLLPAWAVGMLIGFGRGWSWQRLTPLVFIVAFPLASLPAITAAPAVFGRYLVPLLPFAVILAGLGVERLIAWLRGVWTPSMLASARGHWVEAVMALVAAGTLWLSLPTYGTVRYQQQQGQAAREAGLWLESYDPAPDKRILSVFSQLPYYAGGVHVPMPDGSPEQVFDYAGRQRVDYAAVYTARLESRPGLSSWQQAGTLPAAWRAVYEQEDEQGEKLTIYELPRSVDLEGS